ncbi:MAG: hypothetical protein O2914_03495 [Bacteroidetes bacterium]|jgi:hypothetical protein|nr:hypothetical protein [Bacteroidota bacterium]MDA0937880.1 hypothetical protein [Bacteroidota bacterium]MDA1344090.1 hypothetical protein [Bacteroidota bacterium]
MKKTLIALMVVAVGMLIFNLTQVDWASPLEGKSSVAVIGIMAAACAFLLLLLLFLSKKIAEKQSGR